MRNAHENQSLPQISREPQYTRQQIGNKYQKQFPAAREEPHTLKSEVQPEPPQTPKMESFATINNSKTPLNKFPKATIATLSWGATYAHS